MVDASSVNRLEEAKEALANVVQNEKMEGKPLLVFANKQDKEGAVDEAELRTRLELGRLAVRRRGEGGEEGDVEDDDIATTNVVSRSLASFPGSPHIVGDAWYCLSRAVM